MLEVNDGNFESEVGTHMGIVALDFWATWCGPCKMMAPEFEDAAAKLNGIKFGKVNVDENPRLAADLEIMSIPTLVILKDGQEVGRSVGFKQGKVAQFLEQYN